MLPPLPTGSETQSGIPPSCSTTSNAAVFWPSSRYGLTEFRSAIGAALDELSHEPQRVVEVALHRDDARAADLGLGELPARDRALGQDDRQPDAGRGRSMRPPTPTCCLSTRTPLVAPSSSAFDTATVIPRSLNDPVGLAPSYFR